MMERLAGETVPLVFFLLYLLLFLAVLLLLLDQTNAHEAAIEKSAKLEREVIRLKRLNKEAANKPQVVIINGDSLRNQPDLKKIFNSGKNNHKGVRKMSKSSKGKSVLKEIGFIRLAMMFGLSAALANMLMTSWERVRHHFGETENEEELAGLQPQSKHFKNQTPRNRRKSASSAKEGIK